MLAYQHQSGVKQDTWSQIQMIGFMIFLVMDMVGTLISDLKNWYYDFLWKNSEDRRLLAAGRLAAHEQALKDGRNSPYTHPEEYGNFF